MLLLLALVLEIIMPPQVCGSKAPRLLHFFFPTMAASRQSPEVKQVCDRIMQWALEKFTGSGNPEVDDAVDCCLMLRSWSCL